MQEAPPHPRQDVSGPSRARVYRPARAKYQQAALRGRRAELMGADARWAGLLPVRKWAAINLPGLPRSGPPRLDLARARVFVGLMDASPGRRCEGGCAVVLAWVRSL